MKLLLSASTFRPLAKPLPSANNLREHWATKAKRVKAQREATLLVLCLDMRGVRGVADIARAQGRLAQLEVTLTRVASRKLDDDNLAGAFKAVRDEVAAFFGIDDGHAPWAWKYAQDKGAPGYRIEVRAYGYEAAAGAEVAS